MKSKLEEKLHKLKKAPLTLDEKNTLWNSVVSNLPEQSVGFWGSFITKFHSPMITSIALGLVLLLGGSFATVKVADAAKPGDALFSLDRAIEQIQLSLTSDAKKATMQVAIAQERAQEAESVIDSTKVKVKTSNSSSSNSVSADDVARTSLAIQTAISYISQLQTDFITSGNKEAATQMQTVLDRLQSNVNTLSNDIKTKIQTEVHDDHFEFEIESEHEDSGVELRIKQRSQVSTGGDNNDTKNDSNDDSNDDSNSVSSDDSESHSSRGLTEAEGEIRGDQTLVKVEYNDQKYFLTVDATDRVTIVEAIATELNIPLATVDDVFRFDISDSSSSSSDDSSTGNSSDDNSSPSRSSDDDSESHSSRGLTEAEAKIIGGVATVKIEYNDAKRFITVSSRDRATIVAEIARELGLTTSVVDAVLKIEIENEDESDDQSSSNSNNGGEVSIFKKVKIEVEDGVAEGEIELFSGVHTNMHFSGTEKAVIIAEIANAFLVSESEVTAAQDFEFEIKD